MKLPNPVKIDNRDEMVWLDSVSPGSLQNLAMKDVATEAIQSSLFSAKDLGQEKVNSFIEKRKIVPEEKDKPEVPIHATLHKSKAKTFASLYEVAKNPKIKENRPVVMADRNVLHDALLQPMRQLS